MSEKGRPLLTECEREILAGDTDVTDNYEYKVRSIVRNRIQKHLEDDVRFRDEYFHEAASMVREITEKYN